MIFPDSKRSASVQKNAAKLHEKRHISVLSYSTLCSPLEDMLSLKQDGSNTSLRGTGDPTQPRIMYASKN